jgi:hypothetical protein
VISIARNMGKQAAYVNGNVPLLNQILQCKAIWSEKTLNELYTGIIDIISTQSATCCKQAGCIWTAKSPK